MTQRMSIKKVCFLLLLVLLGALCIVAAFWQLTRAKEVAQLQANIAKNNTQPAVRLHNFSQMHTHTQNSAELHMLSVILAGKIVSMPFLLGKSMHTTQTGKDFGYDRLALLATNDGTVLIDFGWLAQDLVAADTTPTLGATINLIATVDALATKKFILGENHTQSAEGIAYMQTIDFPLLESMFKTPILPVVFRAIKPHVTPPALFREKNITHSPMKNYGYAAQWLCFALIAFIGAFILYKRS